MSASGPPRRRVTRAAVRRELLVFVEGRRTEEMYLVDWHRRHRDEVSVSIDPFRGGPLQLVEHAVEAQWAEAYDAKRQRGRPHDQIWCVFDRDDHPNFVAAVDLAMRHDIRLAISNPCVELWFLLHFEDQNAFIDRRQAQDRAEAVLHCSKVLTPRALQALSNRYDEAKARAIKLDEKHEGDGSVPGSNPSTRMWMIVDQLRETNRPS
ncbi:MAG: RloB family protein [Acidimicrobiales bacterium]